MYSLVCVGPGRKHRRPVFSERGSFVVCFRAMCQQTLLPQLRPAPVQMTICTSLKTMLYSMLSILSRICKFLMWLIIEITALFTLMKARITFILTIWFGMSRVMRKPAFCICENKGADQLRGNREADQRLCFRYLDSTIPLFSKNKMSSL